MSFSVHSTVLYFISRFFKMIRSGTILRKKSRVIYSHNPRTHDFENSTKYHKSCGEVEEMSTCSDTAPYCEAICYIPHTHYLSFARNKRVENIFNHHFPTLLTGSSFLMTSSHLPTLLYSRDFPNYFTSESVSQGLENRCNEIATI